MPHRGLCLGSLDPSQKTFPVHPWMWCYTVVSYSLHITCNLCDAHASPLSVATWILIKIDVSLIVEQMCKNLSPTKTRRCNCLVLPHTGYALDGRYVTFEHNLLTPVARQHTLGSRCYTSPCCCTGLQRRCSAVESRCYTEQSPGCWRRQPP